MGTELGVQKMRWALAAKRGTRGRLAVQEPATARPRAQTLASCVVRCSGRLLTCRTHQHPRCRPLAPPEPQAAHTQEALLQESGSGQGGGAASIARRCPVKQWGACGQALLLHASSCVAWAHLLCRLAPPPWTQCCCRCCTSTPPPEQNGGSGRRKVIAHRLVKQRQPGGAVQTRERAFSQHLG